MRGFLTLRAAAASRLRIVAVTTKPDSTTSPGDSRSCNVNTWSPHLPLLPHWQPPCLPLRSSANPNLSGNCYKVRLLLHWLGLKYTNIPVDFHPGREHQSPEFIDNVNPLGQLPVLRDGDFLLRDAQAILVYLASQYDPSGQSKNLNKIFYYN